MEFVSRIRRLTRPVRNAWEALPPVGLLPPIPSPGEIKAWYHEWQHLRFLPPFPRLPGPKKIAKWIRNRPPREWRDPLLPGIPWVADLADWLSEGGLRRKVLLALLILGIGALTGLIFAGN